MPNPERIGVISGVARESADDPRLQRAAVRIFRAHGVAPRDYRGQAAAILKTVQDRCYFVHEKGEVLKDPAYVLDLGDDGSIGPDAAGDCDDQAGSVAALCRSVLLPVRLVTSGQDRAGQPVRYIEGQARRAPSHVQWGHIYNAIGNHPFRPTQWAFADATVPGAPLGWDIVGARGFAPEHPRTPAKRSPSSELGDADTLTGMSFGAALTLVAVSVASHVLIRSMEREGWL